MEIAHLTELFLKVIKINAISGREKSIADFIKTFLSNLGYLVVEDNTKIRTGSDTGNLICKIGSGGDFVLLSHMDTARPTENVKPVVKPDRIESSGDTVLGVDNRAGVSVLLYVLEKISKEKLAVKDFSVAFTTCEETTLGGSRFIELNGNIKKGFVFDSGYRPGNFIFSACGSIGFTMKIVGRASHSGIAPEKGINSLLAASRAITKLPLGRIDEETTMNIGVLKSGSAVNVIPELTQIEGEVRSFNLKKAENYFKQLVDTFKNEADLIKAKVEYDYYWDFKPYTINKDSEVYKELVDAIQKVGLDPIPKISLGGSDANSLNSRGIESINIGIGAQNPHGNDEFIFIEDLVKSAEIALALIRRN